VWEKVKHLLELGEKWKCGNDLLRWIVTSRMLKGVGAVINLIKEKIEEKEKNWGPKCYM
jgi:hypothetical protein